MTFKDLNHSLERALFQRGFTVAGVRHVMMTQFYFLAAACVVGLTAPLVGFWVLSLTAGALIMTYNLYAIATFIQRAIFYKYQKSLLASLLLRLYGRLLLTGLAIVVMLVWLNASVVGLLAGLSTVAAAILVWGGAQIFAHKVKEA